MSLRPSILGSAFVFSLAFGDAQGIRPQPGANIVMNPVVKIPIAQKVLRPRLKPQLPSNSWKKQLGPTLQVESDELSDAVRLISLRPDARFKRLQISDGIPAFETAARNFLTAYRSILQINPEDLRLDTKAIVFDRQDQFLKFRVYRHGFIVQDAVVDVRFKQGALIQIANQSFTEAQDDQRATIRTTKRVLRENLQAQQIQSLGLRYRVISKPTGYQLLKVEVFRITIQQSEYFAQVDAASGQLFELAPTVFYANGTASAEIYPRYYGDSLMDAALPEARIQLSPDQHTHSGTLGDFYAKPNERPSINGLNGTRIKIVPETGSVVRGVGLFLENKWTLQLRRESAHEVAGDKSMAQTMIYAHTSRMIHHARKYISSPWFDQPLQANANLDSVCNAHWDGTTINFYSAGPSGSWNCANTGLIADVIYHEWGHGLDAETGGIEDGAYSEGFGDIMSLLMTRSSILGKGFTVDGQFVRDLEPDKVYPEDKGEVHSEGLIIGGTFFDLYKTLKDEVGDRKAIELLSAYAFKSIVSASKYTDVYPVVLAVDDDDADPTNGTPHFCSINDAFAAHGLATAAPRCLLGNFTRMEIDDRQGNDNGRLDPGETAQVFMHVENITGEPIFGLHAEVAPGDASTHLHLVDPVTEWSDLETAGSGRAKRPFIVTADEQSTCGQVTPLQFRLQANDRTVMANHPIMIGRLLSQEFSYSGSNLPLPIKDNKTVESPITVKESDWKHSKKIFAARLSFQINHSYVGDLTIWLRGPSGQTYEVYRGSGSQDNVQFDKDILSLVKEEQGPGDWALMIRDNFVRDEGFLNHLRLALTPADFECVAQKERPGL